ncbi:hypothetical protein [Streptomyces sp. NPDC050856]|uniref:hypothetical protein n=1 Tax=Streptomyces sp. NPDC050856 TaxID=3154939 RepID=UPI0034071907
MTRRSLVHLGGLTAAAWALGSRRQLAGAATPEPPPVGDHIPATELADPFLCPVPAGHDPEVIRIVHRVGRDLAVNDKVMLAGFEAGWVESHMNNLPCGDKDSVGVFQQRPSQGWGTPEQCMDVAYASNSFFTRAVEVDRQHPEWTAGQVAQGVQRSAFPERYDQAEAKARALLEEAAGDSAGELPTVPDEWGDVWAGLRGTPGPATDGTLSR